PAAQLIAESNKFQPQSVAVFAGNSLKNNPTRLVGARCPNIRALASYPNRTTLLSSSTRLATRIACLNLRDERSAHATGISALLTKMISFRASLNPAAIE